MKIGILGAMNDLTSEQVKESKYNIETLCLYLDQEEITRWYI